MCLCDVTLPGGRVLCDVTLPGGRVLCDVTLPGGRVLGDVTLSGGRVLCDVTLPGGRVLCDGVKARVGEGEEGGVGRTVMAGLQTGARAVRHLQNINIYK